MLNLHSICNQIAYCLGNHVSEEEESKPLACLISLVVSCNGEKACGDKSRFTQTIRQKSDAVAVVSEYI